jgi:hypothetical protein
MKKTLINQPGDSLPCPIFPDKSEKFFTFHLYHRPTDQTKKEPTGKLMIWAGSILPKG